MALVLGLALSACQPGAPVDTVRVLSAEELVQAQRDDDQLLQDLVVNRAALKDDFESFHDSGRWQDRGYFSAQESDRLEVLLYRFHTMHHELSEVAKRHQLVDGSKSASLVRSREIAAKAHELQMEQARYVVEVFAKDAVAIAKLNQSYPRSEIPRHTYDRLEDMLRSDAQRRFAAMRRKMGDDWFDSSYGVQAEVILRVAEFKNPTAYLLNVSDKQKAQVLEWVEPGDLILTFTAGYASTVFIPGKFKHAMVFVGTPEQRQQLGLVPGSLDFPGGASARKRVEAKYSQGRTSDGETANVIEADLSGVKFSNLDRIMDTHMNRMVVIRPRLSGHDRLQFIGQLFTYLGQEYDFRFDFADSSRQVCTEIIYRALNGRGGIDFQLSRHTGHLTLSADDIIHYWLDEAPESFDFILFVDESKMRPGHSARVSLGADGRKRLESLMNKD
ncbi:hypothetical protein HW115_04175 [Verrucomicrobiaceae bacterium N1E253]|uniref:Uncharacterized protein n=1 Tax=Oceaniferula marina TaxID=2748318 RepID=A0A851GG57_9BACT|nr:YiiX/YebB-like N1pC/P60 family cysteine hydrolase [Oceaniferula marina]NWK54791.1 hypothetical protein [Oceaniferula marina]